MVELILQLTTLSLLVLDLVLDSLLLVLEQGLRVFGVKCLRALSLSRVFHIRRHQVEGTNPWHIRRQEGIPRQEGGVPTCCTTGGSGKRENI